MKLWIVGRKGLLGSSLAQLLSLKNIPFVGTGREVDIADLHSLKAFARSPLAEGVTHIVNCAAFTDVDKAEQAKDDAWKTNALGPENLGIIASGLHSHLLHVSTDYVFGSQVQKPCAEADVCNPINAYAETKRAGEENLLNLYPKACIVRTSWLFGKGGKNFLSSLLTKLQTQQTLSVIADQKGRATFVEDLASAIFHLLCHSGIYHFANTGEVSYYDMAKRMVEEARILHLPLQCQEIVPISSHSLSLPAKRPIYSVLCTKKIESILGKAPRHWEHTVEDYVRSHAV